MTADSDTDTLKKHYNKTVVDVDESVEQQTESSIIEERNDQSKLKTNLTQGPTESVSKRGRATKKRQMKKEQHHQHQKMN